jgi:hypothetical protein
LSLDPADSIVLDQKSFDAALAQSETWAGLQHSLHAQPIESFVGLRSRRSNCRSFFSIEGSELNSGFVDSSTHLAAKSVDLFDQVALANTANRRVARHLAYVVKIEGEQQGIAAHTCGCQASFDTCVSRSNDDYIVDPCLL